MNLKPGMHCTIATASRMDRLADVHADFVIFGWCRQRKPFRHIANECFESGPISIFARYLNNAPALAVRRISQSFQHAAITRDAPALCRGGSGSVA